MMTPAGAPAAIPPASGARLAALGADARRAVTAVLRERAHGLPRRIPARLAAAARLLPVLLHASFEQRPLEGDAPGVAGLRYRRRWSTLARAFGLPPPRRAQRGRCLVEAILAVPSRSDLEVLVLVPRRLAAEELGAVQERIEGAQRVLAAAGAPLRAAAYDPARLARDLEATQRALAFGALLAGHIADASWGAIEASRQPLPVVTASALAASAPAPLATLALTLMTRQPCPGPLEAMLSLLAGGARPRDLADPESFCLRWAGLVPGAGPMANEAAELARMAVAPPEPGDLARLVERGRALAHACAGAMRAARVRRVDRLTERLWREALGPGMPLALLPALGARLALESAAGRLRFEPSRRGRAYEVRLPDGTVLGRGASPVQAQVRAIGLAAEAEAARPGEHDRAAHFSALEPAWREIGQRLLRAPGRATQWLVVEAGGGARPGPPLDLLNRGPERALEFEGALSVVLVPGRRPSGRMLSPQEVVETVLRRARAQSGASLQLLAARTASRPVAARLQQIVTLLRDPSLSGPVAVEAGGRVRLVYGQGTRSFPLARFAARPRTFTPDPEAPDVSITTGERQGARSRPAGLVQCRITRVDVHTAALLYADGAGAYLRETVPLAEVEERLRDARAIVRGAEPAAGLAVRLSDGLELALRRAGPPGARVEVAIRGALPFLEVEIAGERFGGRSGLGWRAAAEALLAAWPAGGEGLVGVREVTVTAAGVRPSPLLALYASAAARRRLRTHLLRALSSYRSATARRREG